VTVARVPTAEQDRRLRGLSGWMLGVAILHVGAAAVGALVAFLAATVVPAMLAASRPLGVVFIGLVAAYAVASVLLAVEAVLLVLARSSLQAVLAGGPEEARLLARTMRSVRRFFVVEAAFFGIVLCTVALGFAVNLLTPQLGPPAIHVGRAESKASP
jgi:hypothetical protein